MKFTTEINTLNLQCRVFKSSAIPLFERNFGENYFDIKKIRYYNYENRRTKTILYQFILYLVRLFTKIICY